MLQNAEVEKFYHIKKFFKMCNTSLTNLQQIDENIFYALDFLERMLYNIICKLNLK